MEGNWDPQFVMRRRSTRRLGSVFKAFITSLCAQSPSLSTGFHLKMLVDKYKYNPEKNDTKLTPLIELLSEKLSP